MIPCYLEHFFTWFLKEGRAGTEYGSIGFKVTGFFKIEFDNEDTLEGTMSEVFDSELPEDHVFLMTRSGKLPKPGKKIRKSYYDYYLTKKGYQNSLRPKLVELIAAEKPTQRNSNTPITIEMIDNDYELFLKKHKLN